MKTILMTLAFLGFHAAVHGQDYPDTTQLIGQNCDISTVASGSCSSVNSPYVNIQDYSSDDFPDDGFCIVKDQTMGLNVTGEVPYHYKASVCSGYGYFGGGIFFNYQDEYNYDTFYTLDEDSTNCEIGYVESGVVYQIHTFECKFGLDSVTWFDYQIDVNPGTATAKLTSFGTNIGATFTFTPHFPSTPDCGPLHANDYIYHSHLHFSEATLTLTPYTTPVPTDAPSNETKVQPQYQMKLQGDFISSTGVDFSDSCAISYTTNMNEKVLQMQYAVNQFIGSTLCSSITDEKIEVVAAAGTMTFNDNQGRANPSFYLGLEVNVFISEVESCASEILNFLLLHSNWGEHVVAPVIGCPEVDFVSPEFNHTGDAWICVDSGTLDADTNLVNITDIAENTKPDLHFEAPKYAIGHVGQFYIEDGSDLPVNCLSEYNTRLYLNSIEMANTVNAADLCSDIDVTLSVISAYFNYVSGVSEGLSIQNYTIQPSGNVRFSDVYACADIISQYLSDHTNWVDPIIPQYPGCPKLVFSPTQFFENIQQWVCVGSNLKIIGEDDKVKDLYQEFLTEYQRNHPEMNPSRDRKPVQHDGTKELDLGWLMEYHGEDASRKERPELRSKGQKKNLDKRRRKYMKNQFNKYFGINV